MAVALFLVIALALVAGMSLLSQQTALKAKLAAAESAREEKRLEAESTRAELREKKQELEKTKDELQEARSKSKKKEKESLPPGEKAAKSQKTAPAGPESAVASAVVRISNQELEAEHQTKIDAMEAELASARARVAELEAKEKERAEELERARKRLEAKEKAPSVAPPPPADGLRPDEKVEAMKTQLEAMERAAAEREKQLKKELDKMGVELRSQARLASDSQSLYRVAKGQLVVIEERLANLRKKYEGAVAPEALRKPVSEAAPDVHQAETARPAEVAAAQESAPSEPLPA